MGTLREHQYAFLIISCSVFLRIKNSKIKVVEKIKTHISFLLTFFPEYWAIYEVMWKNIGQSGRPQMTIWRMHFLYWIHKVINTSSKYVILITFPLQLWVHDPTSMLHFMFFDFLLVYAYCSFCFSFLSQLVNILQITNGQLHFRPFIIHFQNTEKLNFVPSAQWYFTHICTCFVLNSYPSD